jgi:hypothetical protein
MNQSGAGRLVTGFVPLWHRMVPLGRRWVAAGSPLKTRMEAVWLRLILGKGTLVAARFH